MVLITGIPCVTSIYSIKYIINIFLSQTVVLTLKQRAQLLYHYINNITGHIYDDTVVYGLIFQIELGHDYVYMR